MRKITATADVASASLIDGNLDPVGAGSSLNPKFFAYSRVELNLDLVDLSLDFVDGAPASFSLSGATGVRFSIAQDFDDATAPLIRIETESADAVDGGNYYQITETGIRLVFTADSEETRAYISSNEDVALKMQLSIAEIEGETATRSILLQSPITIRNDIDPPATTPPTGVDLEYYVKSEIAALLAVVARPAIVYDIASGQIQPQKLNEAGDALIDDGATVTPYIFGTVVDGDQGFLISNRYFYKI